MFEHLTEEQRNILYNGTLKSLIEDCSKRDVWDVGSIEREELEKRIEETKLLLNHLIKDKHGN